jgi:hypothetical protein
MSDGIKDGEESPLNLWKNFYVHLAAEVVCMHLYDICSFQVPLSIIM